MRTSRLEAGVLSVLQFLCQGGGESLAVNRGRWELDVNKGKQGRRVTTPGRVEGA